LNKIRLLDAMAFIHRYFEPLHIQAALNAPLTVSVHIRDPETQRFVAIGDFQSDTTLSCGDIMELILKIESQLEQSHPNIYAYHCGRRPLGLQPKR